MARRYIVLRDRYGNEARMPDPSGLDVPVLGWDDIGERPAWMEAPEGGVHDHDAEYSPLGHTHDPDHTTHDAADLAYDNTASELAAEDVQAAIDEVAAAIAGHVDEHPAGGGSDLVWLHLTTVIDGEPVHVWDEQGNAVFTQAMP